MSSFKQLLHKRFMAVAKDYIGVLPDADLKYAAELFLAFKIRKALLKELLSVPTHTWHAVVVTECDPRPDDGALMTIPMVPLAYQDTAWALKAEYGLCIAELRVLFHVAVTCNYLETAQKLVVSPTTIKTHTNNVFSKLGVKTMVDMCVWAYCHDFPDIDYMRQHHKAMVAA